VFLPLVARTRPVAEGKTRKKIKANCQAKQADGDGEVFG